MDNLERPADKWKLLQILKDNSFPLKNIDTSNITDMSELFANSTRTDFSGIEKWDVSNVENMYAMFDNCKTFNQDISGWDVSKV
ncbi:TPA: BspA family leucine-rich repeat surface protein, partial [Campylobacter jejuni]